MYTLHIGVFGKVICESVSSSVWTSNIEWMILSQTDCFKVPFFSDKQNSNKKVIFPMFRLDCETCSFYSSKCLNAKLEVFSDIQRGFHLSKTSV